MTNCNLTEEDIKLRYITPAIQPKWGYDRMRMEYAFTDGQVLLRGKIVKRGEKKRVDYLLLYKPNLPLAVVEAKSDKHFVGAGMQQAISYAARLDIPFAYSSNGKGFLERDMFNGTECELALADFPSPDDLWERYLTGKGYSMQQVNLINEPYHFGIESHPLRYYQRVAVGRAIEAVARGQNRILLVMATGTGKTLVAFHIIWRLLKSGTKKRILFLADRNILVDQTMQQDFKPFKKIMTKVSGKNLDSSFEVYLSLYQQLAGDETEEPFRQFKPEFFDLIVIDECHRGSAKENSKWRKILDYFCKATHIGMTATPRETDDVSNTNYFGEPLYTYSLKQGIDDGFLAPFKVVRVGLDRDLEGWRPVLGQTDIYGSEIEDREYNITDFDTNLTIDERTQAVASRITRFLISSGDRYSKTIVFCRTQLHAELMKQALVKENNDMTAKGSNYIMRITGDDEEGKKKLDDFIDPECRYPTIVTTSKLLTTGVDCKTVKLIVLDSIINSMTEFKQIIGRGTRLKPEYGKEYFTIMDFRGATRLFADPEFDGDPIQPSPDDEDIGDEENLPPCEPDGDGGEIDPAEPRRTYRVRGVEVMIVSERVMFYDSGGKLITESLTDYTKQNILGMYVQLEDFLAAWNSQIRKDAIIRELEERGVLLDSLRELDGNKDLDDFDLICHIAFDRKPLTKAERASGVRKRDFLSRYEGLARDVLSALLDKFSQSGYLNLAGTEVLELEPFREMGSPLALTRAFGGKQKYLDALMELQHEIYCLAA